MSTRRQFLTHATLGASAFALAPALSRAADSSSKLIKVEVKGMPLRALELIPLKLVIGFGTKVLGESSSLGTTVNEPLRIPTGVYTLTPAPTTPLTLRFIAMPRDGGQITTDFTVTPTMGEFGATVSAKFTHPETKKDLVRFRYVANSFDRKEGPQLVTYYNFTLNPSL